MGFDRMHIRWLLLLASLLLLSLAGAYAVLEQQLYTSLVIAGLWLATAYGLYRWVMQGNRDVARFLEAVEHRDWSLSFPKRSAGAGMHQLHEALNHVLEALRESRIEKETQFQFFSSLTQAIPTGILVLRKDGAVHLMNPAVSQLLGVPEVHAWDRLRKWIPETVSQLESLPDGQKALLPAERKQGEPSLLARKQTLRSGSETFQVYLLHNIQNELDLREMEAWHKLIRVLTHEIMNSVTPITSLTETVRMLLESDAGQLKEPAELTSHVLDDIHLSLQTIEKRSNGLMQFVADYRKLVRLPDPKPEVVQVTELFKRIEKLVTPALEARKVEWTTEVRPSTLEMLADSSLIEQVLLNLVQNASDAVEEITEPSIHIQATATPDVVRISVRDNGEGIPAEHASTIFIPFFSTKQNGSGIGLSLTRNIMRLHRGSVFFESEAGSTTFVLEFPR